MTHLSNSPGSRVAFFLLEKSITFLIDTLLTPVTYVTSQDSVAQGGQPHWRPPSSFPYKPTPARLSGVMDEGILTTIVIVIYFTAKTLAIVIRCLFVESCQKVCDQISRLSDPCRFSFT
jgi:hypothetical protein